MDLIREQDLVKDLQPDHFNVLMNYAKHSNSQILLNEFMCTKSSTIIGTRKFTDVNIHLHDVFDLHPQGVDHKQKIQNEIKDVPNVFFHSTTPLEVNQPTIEENGPYDLVYVNLPWKLPQSPNTVELVIAETIKLWWWALEENGVMIIPDYNRTMIRRQVDSWIKIKKCSNEKYLNTNWDREDLEADHFMIAIQKNG